MKTYKEILQQLKAKNYAPVYLLYGEEAYYIDLVADYVEQNVLDTMAREFDQTVVYSKDLPGLDVATVISAARRYPMMGERQVIIVKEAQNIKNWEALQFYLEQPLQSTLLLFCYKYGKPDLRLKVFKNFEKNGGVLMESARLRDDYQVEKWILDYVKEYSKKIGRQITLVPPAPTLLATSLGTDLQKVVAAIDKLLLAAPEGTTQITPELVERNIGISKDFNVFELQKALVNNDVLKANRIANYFAGSKDHVIQKELVVLFSFFANLMIYHYLRSANPTEVASILHISPYFVKDYEAAAKRFSAGKTMRIIGYLRDTDARSKGVENNFADSKDLWQELIYKILH